MIIAGFSEVASLGLLVPFLGILSGGMQSFENAPMALSLITKLGLTTSQSIILFTIIFGLIVVFSSGMRLLLNARLAHTNFYTGHVIGSLIYSTALYQPYDYHLNHNSSEIVGGIAKVDITIQVLMAVLIGISSAVMSIFIIVTLFFINALAALFAVVGFGSMYILIGKYIHRKLLANGRVVNFANPARLKVMNEGLGGIRDVILGNTQLFHLKRFNEIDSSLRDAQESNQVFGPAPRFLLEAMAMLVIAVAGCWFTLFGGGLLAILPTLAVLVIGGQRLSRLGDDCWASSSNCRCNFANIRKPFCRKK